MEPLPPLQSDSSEEEADKLVSDCSHTAPRRVPREAVLSWVSLQSSSSEGSGFAHLSPLMARLSAPPCTYIIWPFIQCCPAWFSKCLPAPVLWGRLSLPAPFPMRLSDSQAWRGPLVLRAQGVGRRCEWSDLPWLNTAVSSCMPAQVCLTGEQLCATSVCPSVSLAGAWRSLMLLREGGRPWTQGSPLPRD